MKTHPPIILLCKTLEVGDFFAITIKSHKIITLHRDILEFWLKLKGELIMKNNFGLKIMCKNIQDAKAGKINMLHLNTEFSNYDAVKENATSKEKEKIKNEKSCYYWSLLIFGKEYMAF